MSHTFDRRRFLRGTAAALGSGVLVGQVARSEARADDADTEPIPIVDTHQHLWDLELLDLGWVKGSPHLDRSFLMSDYQDAARGLNVVKTVYMEVAVDEPQLVAEAEYVLDLCRRDDNPMVGAVISGRPESEDFPDYLHRFEDEPYVKGLRRILHAPDTPPGYCLDPTFIKNIQLLGEIGLSFDLCLRPGELLDGVKLIESCPDTAFILDHCGNANVQADDLSGWRADIARVADQPNVVVKVSGIVASADPETWTPDVLAPVVNHTLEVFGPDRVVFGGDWPVCTRAATLAQWVNALKAIVRDRPADHQRKLFHDNALRVYRLT